MGSTHGLPVNLSGNLRLAVAGRPEKTIDHYSPRYCTCCAVSNHSKGSVLIINSNSLQKNHEDIYATISFPTLQAPSLLELHQVSVQTSASHRNLSTFQF
jgi:hypothetical protein